MCQIRENIANLSPDIIRISLEQLHELLNQALLIDNGISLHLSSCCDVRDHPTGLSPYYFFMMLQYFLKWIQDASCEYLIGVIGSTSGDIAKYTNGRDEERHIIFL